METFLNEKSYEELVQLQQDGEITLLQFVEAQEDLSEDWKKWVQSHPRDNESANAFLNEIEKICIRFYLLSLKSQYSI